MPSSHHSRSSSSRSGYHSGAYEDDHYSQYGSYGRGSSYDNDRCSQYCTHSRGKSYDEDDRYSQVSNASAAYYALDDSDDDTVVPDDSITVISERANARDSAMSRAPSNYSRHSSSSSHSRPSTYSRSRRDRSAAPSHPDIDEYNVNDYFYDEYELDSGIKVIEEEYHLSRKHPSSRRAVPSSYSASYTSEPSYASSSTSTSRRHVIREIDDDEASYVSSRTATPSHVHSTSSRHTRAPPRSTVSTHSRRTEPNSRHGYEHDTSDDDRRSRVSTKSRHSTTSHTSRASKSASVADITEQFNRFSFGNRRDDEEEDSEAELLLPASYRPRATTTDHHGTNSVAPSHVSRHSQSSRR